jgi:hypothetical protein
MLPHCTSTIYHTCSTSFGLKYSQIIDVYILFFLLSDMLFHCTRAQSKFSQTLTFKFSFQSARTVNIKPRKRLKHLTLVIIVHPYCFESRYVRSVSIILPCQL